jgi:amino acid transporter
MVHEAMELRRSLRMADGLAVVVGIMVGSGIFRTPGVVVAELGRASLTFVAWILGGVIAFFGALIFAELATRHPHAGGKYVYAREAFGPRTAFVIGLVEALGIYAVAIAALGVVVGEYAGRLIGWSEAMYRPVGAAAVAGLTAVNLLGVSHGRWLQNVATAAKVLALAAVAMLAFGIGTGAGWRAELPRAPTGVDAWIAIAAAFQSVVWTYYGYPDAAKIAEEIVDPDKNLPRVFLGGIAVTMALYLLLNAAFVHVLPLEQIASSNLVAADVATVVFGERGGTIIAALAMLVVLASINGNVIVTPRVIFAMARDGLLPRLLASINRGGTPWAAMLLVGVVAIALAATGTFEQLLRIAVALVLITDGLAAIALMRLRRLQPSSRRLVPFYPLVPLVFIAVYLALFAGAAIDAPFAALISGGILVITWAASFFVLPLV